LVFDKDALGLEVLVGFDDFGEDANFLEGTNQLQPVEAHGDCNACWACEALI
jgi:hypothetical protein